MKVKLQHPADLAGENYRKGLWESESQVTWKMERSNQGGSPQGELEKPDILREFQTSFFSMRRLVSFPWTVSSN